MKRGAHGKKPGALRAPGSTQLPHNVLYYKHYLQLFNTEKVFSPWQPIWKRCEDRNDSNLSQKGPYFLHTNSYNAFDLFFLFSSFSDNVHFYVFWCLLARSKTQYQSFCDWVVWGQNRTKRCKSYFVFHIHNFKESPALCSRNFQYMKLRLAFVQILSFYRHSDFLWNHILGNSSSPKMLFLTILEVLNFEF